MYENKLRLVLMLAVLIATAGLSQAQDLPSTFDLRDVDGVNYVTAVKGQQGGTCWTHGAMSAMESNLLMTGVWKDCAEAGEPNLAEYHLDWWNGFNRFNNDDTNPPTGGGLTVHFGGDYRVTAAYTTRGEGPVRDIDGQQYNVAPDRYREDFHIYYAPTIEWYVAGSNLSNIDTIKTAVMEHGAVGTCMCYENAFINSSFIHYQNPSSSLEPNHAIAIIGWDDNKNTQHQLHGAWLCKNSWGPNWGLAGCFWISYYDKHCGQHPEMGAISYQDVVYMPYDKIYYHDYHAWRDTMTGVTEAFNAFTAELTQPGERLRAVSFFTAVDNVAYTIRIYNRFEGGVLLDEESVQSGVIGHEGFHTITLVDQPYLPQGDEFYVYVELGSGGHPYDRTSEVPVLLGASERVMVESSAAPGESYYRSGGAWVDLNTFNNTANFCIKALTSIEPAVNIAFPEELPEGPLPIGVSVPVTVQITPGLGTYVPGTAMLNYRFSPEDDFAAVPLTALGSDLFEVDFPHTAKGSKPEYYFSAEGSNGDTTYSPKKAPEQLYTFECYIKELVVEDNFETDKGWTVINQDVTDGGWERGDPAGTTAQPEDDHSETGTLCWVTGKQGGTASSDDLDGGPATLTSPPIDLSGGDAIITFYVWYYHSTSGQQEPLHIRIANDGIAFFLVDLLKNKPQWTKYSIRVSDYVAPSSHVQIRFQAVDNPDDSVVEALVDDFSVHFLNYEPCLWADQYTLPASAASVTNLSLDAGVEHAGRTFLILGSLSGTVPGFTLPGGLNMPLNWDAFTDLMLSLLNTGVCTNFYGTLDQEGRSQAVLNVPGAVGPAMINEVATFAFVLTPPMGLDFTSNSVGMTFEP
ncbi:MAG: lectin like domain-containing protein [Planctomycetota bacterium]